MYIMKRLFYVLSLLMVTSNWIVAQQPTTVQTPQGSIVADTYIWPEEFRAADVEYINKRVKIEYPRAIVLKPATTTYNCHAYAWHISEGGSAVWMGRYTNPTSIYWTDGSYVEISNPIEGAKVSYANDNHSAVVTNDIDVFISKWGKRSLVKHEKHYCPYESSSLRYFVKFRPVLTGPTQICDAGGTFTLSNLPAGATVQWSTDNAKALRIAAGQSAARATVERGPLSLAGMEYRVTATVSYQGASTTLSRTVQVGTPAPSIAGPYEGLHVVNEVRPCQTYTCQVHNTQSGVKRYDWWLYGDDFSTGLSIGNYASFSVSRPGEYTITCKQYQEGCGWSSEARLMVYARGNGCSSWGIKPNPTPGPIDIMLPINAQVEAIRSNRENANGITLRQVQVFSADGRLVLERRYPTGTVNAHIDLSPLRPGSYHLLINGTEHHVVVRE